MTPDVTPAALRILGGSFNNRIAAALDSRDRLIAELVKTLEWYGDQGNYQEDGIPGELHEACDPFGEPFDTWLIDGGERARACLATISENTSSETTPK